MKCPECEAIAQWTKATHEHHGDTVDFYWCRSCGNRFTSTITGAEARRAFMGIDPTKNSHIRALERIAGRQNITDT